MKEGHIFREMRQKPGRNAFSGNPSKASERRSVV